MSDRSLAFSKNEVLCLWGIFWISFAVRGFKISRPLEPYFEETRFNQNATESYRALLPSFNSENMFRFRIVNSVVGSLVPVGVCAILLVQGVGKTASVTGALLISFDFASIITSRTWNVREIFLLLCVGALVFLVVAEKKRNAVCLALSSVFCGAACVFDLVGVVVSIYCLLFVSFGNKTRNCLMFMLSPLICCGILWFWQSEGSFLQDGIRKRLTTFENWYVFPLWKFAPKTLFEIDDVRIAIVNNPVTILICSCFAALGIWKVDSLFYFITTLVIFLIHGVGAPQNYLLALVFGSLSTAKSLHHFPCQFFFGALIVILLLTSFVLWSAMIYGFHFALRESSTADLPL